MDINLLLQQGGLTALGGLALYLVKVVVNDLNHDARAIKESSQRQEALLMRVIALLERAPYTAREDQFQHDDR